MEGTIGTAEIESPSLRDGMAPPAVVAQQDQQTIENQGQQVEVHDVEDSNAAKGRRKRISTMWNFFEECTVPSKKERGKMEDKVKCTACGALLAWNSSGTTSSWKRHLEQCDSFKLQHKSKKQQLINLPTINEGDVDPDLDGPSIVSPGYYDPTKIRRICKLIIVHELPFSIVEYTWFNILLKALNPAYKKVSRNTIRTDYMKLYEFEKEALKKSFKDIRKISLT
ncbi:hypothetical protein ACP70R_048248 [Stipagrostis hirtigluma subsp. patula]